MMDFLYHLRNKVRSRHRDARSIGGLEYASTPGLPNPAPIRFRLNHVHNLGYVVTK